MLLNPERSVDCERKGRVIRCCRIGESFLILVLAAGDRAAEDAAQIASVSQFAEIEFSGRSFLTMAVAKSSEPVPLFLWPKRFGLPTTTDIVNLGKAVADMRRRAPRGRSGERPVSPRLRRACR